MPQLRRVVHQRENEALSNSVEELIQVSAEDADILLNESDDHGSLAGELKSTQEPKISL